MSRPFSETMLGRAPEHLRHAVRLLRTGKVRGILDRKARIVHVDHSIDNEARRHFIALHEVGHDLLPWQRDLGYADDDRTLAPGTRRVFEREANQCAAEMFFQGTRFAKIAANYAIGTAAIVDLHKMTGASLRDDPSLRGDSQSRRLRDRARHLAVPARAARVQPL